MEYEIASEKKKNEWKRMKVKYLKVVREVNES